MLFVVSGTLWCGHGNVASGPNELGRFKHTDACCRTHDMCPDVMSAGESKHGLTNTASHTRFLLDSSRFRPSSLLVARLCRHFSIDVTRLFRSVEPPFLLFPPLPSFLSMHWTHARVPRPTDGPVDRGVDDRRLMPASRERPRGIFPHRIART